MSALLTATGKALLNRISSSETVPEICQVIDISRCFSAFFALSPPHWPVAHHRGGKCCRAAIFAGKTLPKGVAAPIARYCALV
jgi:hypothetical protein